MAAAKDSTPLLGGEPVQGLAGDAIERIADLARRGADVAVISLETKGLGVGLPEKVPLLFDRSQQQLVSLNSEIGSYRQSPARRTGTASADTLAAFVELVNRHRDGNSALFAQAKWPEPALQAVINYHGAGEDHEPRHLDHRVVYKFPVTEEFKAWMEQDGEAMKQFEFAAFLEEHAAELAAPADGEKSEFERLFQERFALPNELIKLSRELEVFAGARVKNAQRLKSGERSLQFDVEHKDGQGNTIDIPGVFMVSVAAFYDGEAVRIPARLRYRLAGGDIVWLYQLYRAEFWLRSRVREDAGRAARETGLPLYEGAPETPLTRIA